MAGTYQHISHGFDPVYDARSRVLVLGSFPSVQSRANEFYYGNPQNRFWRVIAAYVGCEAPDTIASKKQMLLDAGIALWDVIAECDIKGSSDASIKNVAANDVARVLEEAPIHAVICNGATAGRLYRKYLEYRTGIPATVLPSTSPANAAWSLERLCERWSEALTQARLAEAEATLARNLARRGVPAATDFGTHRSMQGNKGKDTKPELLVRERLREAGLTGYRLQWKVPGRPDIAWPGRKVAVFINGCFWHRCPRCNPSTPKKNVEYWGKKFARNVERDAENLTALREDGWTVHVLWECQLKKKTREATFAELMPELARELDKPLD
ncbi:DNA-deoxyinosine glycosylase [Paratractidigestivibacter sp.]|uniref:DNA-deoxyinosine glycosylase n=1 Tax=Paratractidigestivibacter sp. TaxID=2847316 RepID=UPI002AC8D149|nr:DNA-deoxyinosine glycosylase [Paratractidigestivibacter sp.]